MEIGMDVSPPSSKILYSSTFPTLDSNRRSFEIATPGGRLVSVCKRAETIATTRNVQLQFSRFLRSGFNFGRKLGTRRSVVQVEPAKDTMTLRISDNIFRYSFFIPSHFKISRLSIFSFLSLAFDSKKKESRNESFSLREFACTKTMRNLLKFRVAVHSRYSRRDAASPPRVE